MSHHMGCSTQKGPLCPESLSYQKKGGRAGPRLPFFYYDTDFLEFFEKKDFFDFFFLKSSFFWYDNDSGH